MYALTLFFYVNNQYMEGEFYHAYFGSWQLYQVRIVLNEISVCVQEFACLIFVTNLRLLIFWLILDNSTR